VTGTKATPCLKTRLEHASGKATTHWESQLDLKLNRLDAGAPLSASGTAWRHCWGEVQRNAAGSGGSLLASGRGIRRLYEERVWSYRAGRREVDKDGASYGTAGRPRTFQPERPAAGWILSLSSHVVSGSPMLSPRAGARRESQVRYSVDVNVESEEAEDVIWRTDRPSSW
jgi:hypothetical protein